MSQELQFKKFPWVLYKSPKLSYRPVATENFDMWVGHEYFGPRFFQKFIKDYKAHVFSQAKNWLEHFYELHSEGRLVIDGWGLSACPYPKGNDELIGNLEFRNSGDDHIVLRFGKDDFTFEITPSNFDIILNKAIELLTEEIEKREAATQAPFNEIWGISLI